MGEVYTHQMDNPITLFRQDAGWQHDQVLST